MKKQNTILQKGLQGIRKTIPPTVKIVGFLAFDFYEMLELEKGGIDKNANHRLGFYSGEANFAQLVLDLLEHLKEEK